MHAVDKMLLMYAKDFQRIGSRKAVCTLECLYRGIVGHGAPPKSSPSLSKSYIATMCARSIITQAEPRRSAMHRMHHSYMRDIMWARRRSEEHTSELQSRGHLVCRLLLEKK